MKQTQMINSASNDCGFDRINQGPSVPINAPPSKSVFVVAITLFVSVSGCGNMLDRQAPSKDAYIAYYLEYFDGSQIEKLDYVYKGAIGGAATIGRAQFKGPVSLDNILLQEKIKEGLVTEGTYDPAEMAEQPMAMHFRHQWENHARGELPPWFDFPFDRKMRTISESFEGDDNNPRHERIWYIDDERNIVYIRANWG